MVEEEDRIDRRHHVRHEALWGDVVAVARTHAAVHVVVRTGLEDTEAGHAAVPCGLRAAEGREVGRGQGGMDHVERDRAGGNGVERRLLAAQAARVRLVEEHAAGGVGLGVEQHVGVEADVTLQQLAVARARIEHAAGDSPVVGIRERRAQAIVEILGACEVGAVVRVEYAVEHAGRDTRLGGPVPVGQGEGWIAAQLTADLLEPAEVAAVPGQEPPVAMRAVERVDQGLAVPVPRVFGRQRQHGPHGLRIALEHARPHS